MKTIIVNARFLTQQITGVQRFAIEISLLLKQLLPNIIFVCPKNVENKSVAISLNAISYGKLKGHLWEQLELPFFASSYKNALILNFCNTAPVVYKNKVVTVHDLAFYHHPEWFSFLFYTYYKFLLPRVIKTSLLLLTVSRTSKEDLMQTFYISSDKIVVVYNSINSLFKNNLKNKIKSVIPTFFKNLHLPDYLLAVSSLNPRKNFKLLIQAFERIHNKSIKLIIVGASNGNFSQEDLSNVSPNSSSILFTGYISDEELVYLYKHAIAFVYPSLFEGFGIPPLEAMACGCPTIVSKIPSLEEVCGDASFYVDPYDVTSITNGIEKVINDVTLRKYLIEAGYKRAETYSWEKSVNRILNSLVQLCNK